MQEYAPLQHFFFERVKEFRAEWSCLVCEPEPTSPISVILSQLACSFHSFIKHNQPYNRLPPEDMSRGRVLGHAAPP